MNNFNTTLINKFLVKDINYTIEDKINGFHNYKATIQAADFSHNHKYVQFVPKHFNNCIGEVTYTYFDKGKESYFNFNIHVDYKIDGLHFGFGTAMMSSMFKRAAIINSYCNSKKIKYIYGVLAVKHKDKTYIEGLINFYTKIYENVPHALNNDISYSLTFKKMSNECNNFIEAPEICYDELLSGQYNGYVVYSLF